MKIRVIFVFNRSPDVFMDFVVIIYLLNNKPSSHLFPALGTSSWGIIITHRFQI